MGLDQYFYKYNPNLEENKASNDPEKRIHEEFHWWRKHPAIHDWMEKLWISKNRPSPKWYSAGSDCNNFDDKTDFNLIPLELTVRDLVALTKAIENDELNYSASGFFFGRSSNPSDNAFSDQKENDFDAIKKALDAMADGFIVYYNSWW